MYDVMTGKIEILQYVHAKWTVEKDRMSDFNRLKDLYSISHASDTRP